MKRRIAITTVAIVVASVTALCLIGCGNKALENVDAVVLDAAKTQFGSGSGFVGYASDGYVEQAEYEVKQCKVSDKKIENNKIVGTAAITLENGYFESEGTYTFTADVSQNDGVDNVKLELQSQTTSATRGILGDEEHGVTGQDVHFNEGDQTCFANVPNSDDSTWYKTSGKTSDVKYAFDGEKWSYVESKPGTEKGAQYTLEGTFVGQYKGNETELIISFISNEENQITGLEYHPRTSSGEAYSPSPSFMINPNAIKLGDGSPIDIIDYGNGFIGFRCTHDDLQKQGKIAVGTKADFIAVVNAAAPDEIRIFRAVQHPDSTGDYCESWYSSTTTKGKIVPLYSDRLPYFDSSSPQSSWGESFAVLKRQS